ncbi:GTP 3',8-cyclase [subsurface metagenome]
MTADKRKNTSVLNKALSIFFKDALRVAIASPLQAYFFYKTIRWQRKASRIRSNWEQQDVHIPPIIIFSITYRCNLQCDNCYAQELHPSSDNELSEDEIRNIFREARELGVSFFVIAGGEPFIRPELLRITSDFPEILFLVFTNGLLIDDEVIRRMKRQKNIIPLISLEGQKDDTNKRRGKGVHERLQKIIKELRRNSMFFGISLTITRQAFDTLTNQQFIQNLIAIGCKFFLFLEYTPISEGTEDFVLTDEQRKDLMHLMDSFHAKRKALFITVPGAEEEVGGCLSAGRGFVHITAGGDVEPCPFAPFSDTNVRDSSLKEALQSNFLKKIRQHPEELSVTEGGCILWKKREWVKSLLKK